MNRPAERIIVTGGVGFIGTSVCRLLAARGTPFTIVDRVVAGEFRGHVREADIRDLEALRRGIEGDCLIHLAAVHRDDVVRCHSMARSTSRARATSAGSPRKRGSSGSSLRARSPSTALPRPKPARTGRYTFNDYGRTKYAVEEVLRAWHAAAPGRRSLTIIRATVVFGPSNRGNVYNLLRQIQSGSFMMVGEGQNWKSMAYVDNVAAFFVHALDFAEGVHLYNYIDKPDYTMNELVRTVRRTLKGSDDVGLRLPLAAGLALGRLADVAARLLGRMLPVSHIRVKKFTSTTRFASAAHAVPGFTAPVSLDQGLLTTLEREFIRPDPEAQVFFTE